MKCLHCVNLDLKSYPKHATAGMGRCKAALPGVFVGIVRDMPCKDFVEASKEIIEKRELWAKR